MILDIMLHYLCECGRMDCHEIIPFSDEVHIDFNEYKDQRDSYCLISTHCPGIANISKSKIVVEGDGYMIVEEGDE